MATEVNEGQSVGHNSWIFEAFGGELSESQIMDLKNQLQRLMDQSVASKALRVTIGAYKESGKVRVSFSKGLSPSESLWVYLSKEDIGKLAFVSTPESLRDFLLSLPRNSIHTGRY